MVQKKISLFLAHPLLLLLGGLLLFTTACSTAKNESFAATHPNASDRPKNIILMIGDGMGLTQVSAAIYENKRATNFERFHHIGFHKSYAAGELITDSAAGATAFACGIKTYNGAIGVNIDTIPQQTILEEAEIRGLSTGLIATAFIVHATPAAFFGHQPVRTFHEQIAADLLEVDVDLVIGGGMKYFNRRDLDDRDLYKELQNKGYAVSNYMEVALEDIDISNKRKIVHFTADRHPVPVSAGRNYLPFATKLAPRFLRKVSEDKGFFLMIEGSQIDWAGHGNQGQLMIEETLDFDRAVGQALDFARIDGNTLVIVTADHETGGLAINPGSQKGDIHTAFTTNGHTGSLVPVFAYGPGAENFKGIYENTAIYHKMRRLFGFDQSTAASPIDTRQ
jgi:alkaline phosphatase